MDGKKSTFCGGCHIKKLECRAHLEDEHGRHHQSDHEGREQALIQQQPIDSPCSKDHMT